MIIHEAPQGSPEWHVARAGVITASTAKTIITPAKYGANKGGFSETALSLAFRLAIERISGQPLSEGVSTWAMDRGHELEPEARGEHELSTGHVVQCAGFITTDDELFGASVDGLIGDDGGAEYKCFIDAVKLRAIIVDRDLSEVIDQCQFGMAVTGRKWWDFGLYCPALRPIDRHFICHRIDRDDDYIDKKMWPMMLAFNRQVEQYRSILLAGDVPVIAASRATPSVLPIQLDDIFS